MQVLPNYEQNMTEVYMVRVNILLRICAGLLDAVIISMPVQLFLVSMFALPDAQVNFLYCTLFAVYGTLFTEYVNGRTLGKILAKTKVISSDGTKPEMLYIGLREMVKAMYLVPFVGWAVGIISGCMMLFGNGRTLHDIIGNTRVIYVWQETDVEGEAINKEA